MLRPDGLVNAVELVMAVTGQSKERAEKTLADRSQLMTIDEAIDLVMSLRAPMKTRMRHCDILRRAKKEPVDRRRQVEDAQLLDMHEKTTSLALANIGAAIGLLEELCPMWSCDDVLVFKLGERVKSLVA